MKVNNQSFGKRVKCASIHSTQPIMVVGLNSGGIQFWDTSKNVMQHEYNCGPNIIRSVDMHSERSIFASASDHEVKVWDYMKHLCLFTLQGHRGNVRSVHFHSSFPWILSASDDRTLRIWNHETTECLQIVKGHTHYVMSAFFHPTENVIVSASLDKTVRVWDFQFLTKTLLERNSNSEESKEQSSAMRLSASSREPTNFQTSGTVLKHILRGHEKGVHFASFHPTLPIVVSGSDDKHVRIWNLSNTTASF